MTALAGKCQEVFMTAVFALHTGEAVVQIAAVEIAVYDPFQIRPPESVLPGETIVIDPDKGLEVVLDAAVIIRILRVSGAINSGGKRHDFSPSSTSCRHNIERTFY